MDVISPRPFPAAAPLRSFAMLLAVLVLLCTAPALCRAADTYGELIRIDRYDAHFKEFCRRYFGDGFDWRLFKAQGIAESRLNPDAVSTDGAVGIMQLLPETFRQMKNESGDIKGDIRSPRWNIAAGIYYDRRLWNLWEAKRPFRERVRFMFGAYNAGRDTMLKAQQVAIEQKLNPFVWSSMERTLKTVIGAEYRQTVAYVDKILRIRKMMKDGQEAANEKRAGGGRIAFAGPRAFPFEGGILADKARGMIGQAPATRKQP